LNDPAGQDIDAIRPIRDDIRHRIENLIAEIKSQSSAVWWFDHHSNVQGI
jgi:arsenate reductase